MQRVAVAVTSKLLLVKVAIHFTRRKPDDGLTPDFGA